MKKRIELSALLLSAILVLPSLSACSKSGGIPDGSETESESAVDSETGENRQGGTFSLDTDDKGKLTEEKGGTSSVDFSVREGVPLFKRQSYMISGSANFNKYTPELLELRSRGARFGLVMNCGGSDTEVEQLMRNNMLSVSGFGNRIRKYTTPMWICFYSTAAVKPENREKYGDKAVWYEPDYSIYDAQWKKAANYQASKGMRSFYEVWNEPDQPNYMWYDGWDGYIRLYQHTADAIRSGDSDAFVGGPAMSSVSIVTPDGMKKFVNSVNDSDTALDFFSMHYYANDPKYSLEQILSEIRGALTGKNKSTQIIFTEFNTHCPIQGEWDCAFEKRTDFTLQKMPAAVDGLHSIKTLLGYTDVTQVDWANLFSNNGSLSLIDPKGNKSPLYHALWLYAHMPVERVKTELAADSGITALASSDETSSGVLLWNENGKIAKKISLGLDNIPYDNYTVKVYRIDQKHSSYVDTGSDDLECLTQLDGTSSDNLVWKGTIPANGIVYISIETGEKSKLDDHHDVGTLVRTDYYYDDRTKDSYADFDELTSTAYVGTGSQGGRGTSYVTYSKISSKIKVDAKLVNLSEDIKNGFLTIRVDYHTEGGYTSSVSYDFISGEHSIPYGTGRAADKTEKIGLSDSFTVDINGNAPAGWDGKVVISFDIEGTGCWSEAMFRLTSAD